jgi:ribonuclease HI
LRTKGLNFNNTEDIIRHGVQLYFHEHLRCTKPTTTQKERKRQRLKPPSRRSGFVLYRSDGAARGQGRQSDVPVGCGWGAVCFGASGQDTVPDEVAWGWLGEGKTNNEAEYVGLLMSLDHARARGHQRICYQLDSLLVANQVSGIWACRSTCLHPYYSDAMRKVSEMEASGVHIIIEHIYREFNTMADKYANKSVHTRETRDWHAPAR